jgi:hypothetical protein
MLSTIAAMRPNCFFCKQQSEPAGEGGLQQDDGRACRAQPRVPRSSRPSSRALGRRGACAAGARGRGSARYCPRERRGRADGRRRGTHSRSVRASTSADAARRPSCCTSASHVRAHACSSRRPARSLRWYVLSTGALGAAAGDRGCFKALGDLLGGGARTGEEVGVEGPLKDARRPAIGRKRMFALTCTWAILLFEFLARTSSCQHARGSAWLQLQISDFGKRGP